MTELERLASRLPVHSISKREMSFCEAARQAYLEKTIVSNKGNRYTIRHLSPITGGDHWCIIPSTTSITKSEREGKWTVE